MSVKGTIIIYTEQKCLIAYGFNQETSKYYGLFGTYPYKKPIEELVKLYSVPGQPCYVYQLDEKGRYDYVSYLKSTPNMQLPMMEIGKPNKLQYDFPLLKALDFTFDSALITKNIEILRLDQWSNLSKSA
jgi:hypothetical protein